MRTYAGKEYDKGAAYKQKELLADLEALHAALEEELDMDLVGLICPRGWQLDHTEHAACEKRRYDDAVAAIGEGRRPRRVRDVAGAAARQAVRCRRLRACWRALGFKALPSAAARVRRSRSDTQ